MLETKQRKNFPVKSMSNWSKLELHCILTLALYNPFTPWPPLKVFQNKRIPRLAANSPCLSDSLPPGNPQYRAVYTSPPASHPGTVAESAHVTEVCWLSLCLHWGGPGGLWGPERWDLLSDIATGQGTQRSSQGTMDQVGRTVGCEGVVGAGLN